MKDGSFHVLIYTAIFLILGMIKTRWTLFFLKQPSRFMIIVITTIGFMVGFTLYGEAMRQEKSLQKKVESTEITSPSAELPTVK